MDETRLNRLREELAKARSKRDLWIAKVESLEKKLQEAENSYIYNVVHAARLTPEQVGELIRSAGFLPELSATDAVTEQDERYTAEAPDEGDNEDDKIDDKEDF